MAGFFDKLNKAIGDISKKVEESGIVDDLKDMVSDGGSSASSDSAAAEQSAASTSGDSSGPSGWDGAVERAGLDPMKLLTPAEMDAVVGLGLDHSYQQMEDEWFGVTWTTQQNGGPYVEARFTHGYTDGSPVDVAGMWQFVTLEAGATTPADVEGATAAFDDLDTLYVKTDKSLFFVVSGGLPDGTDVRTLHLTVARAVVPEIL